MNIHKLREVLAVQTTSYNDDLMREYLVREFKSIPGCEYHDDGDNIYAGKGTGIRPCIVAHMDTVHDIVEDLTVIESMGRLFGFNMMRMEQTGIGGDDKVGIHIALEMLRHYDNVKVAFFRDEEVGCHGSELAVKDFFKDASFVLQCDRRGNKDFVTNASGVELSSLAFQSDITPILKEYGYSFTTGMMTDVMALKEGGIPVAMANMSCGYYNPHMADEYVVIADVWACQNMVADIIDQFGSIQYVHVAPERAYPKFDWDAHDTRTKEWIKDRELNWWKDDKYTADRHEAPRHKSVLDHDICADCGLDDTTGPDGLCDTCRDYYKHAPIGVTPPAPALKDREIYKKLDRLVKEKAQITSKLDGLRKLDGVHRVRAYPPAHAKECKCLECDTRRADKQTVNLRSKPDYGQTYYRHKQPGFGPPKQWGKKKKKFKK